MVFFLPPWNEIFHLLILVKELGKADKRIFLSEALSVHSEQKKVKMPNTFIHRDVPLVSFPAFFSRLRYESLTTLLALPDWGWAYL